MSDEDGELPYTVGSKPHTVRIYRRRGRKNIYIRVWDSDAGSWKKRSLGHADVQKAKEEAADLHAELVKGEKALEDGPTLGRLFTLYKKARTPQKSENEQRSDERRITMWTRWLGADKDPEAITGAEWRGFIEARSGGTIDSRGRREGHPDYNGRKVSLRTVEADLRFLLAVLNWAQEERTEDGYLISGNVCRGYDVPTNPNPKRPIATDERVAAIREVVRDVTMRVEWENGYETVPSHLPCIFDLAVETGRRLSSILNLRHSDLLDEKGPHGSIRWRAEHDKQDNEQVVPINARARQALDRHRARMRDLGLRGIGDAPLFPAPRDPSEAVTRGRADTWLREAESQAEVEPHDGSLWHAYRRRWATVRKKMSPTDVAEAGGWKGPDTLQKVYQKADPDTMYEVVSGGGELREDTGA